MSWTLKLALLANVAYAQDGDSSTAVSIFNISYVTYAIKKTGIAPFYMCIKMYFF